MSCPPRRPSAAESAWGAQVADALVRIMVEGDGRCDATLETSAELAGCVKNTVSAAIGSVRLRHRHRGLRDQPRDIPERRDDAACQQSEACLGQ
jgi:hypothetical protein